MTRKRFRPDIDRLEARELLAVVIAPITPLNVQEGQPAAATISATGDPGMAITFALGGSPPAGATINPTTGVFLWTPPPIQAIYNLTVDASECDGEMATAQLTVRVFDNAPLVNTGINATATVGTVFERSGSFSDPDPNDSWTASVDFGDGSGDGPLPLDGKSFTLDHTYDAPGVYSVGVTVLDSQGGQGRGFFSVTVTAAAPVTSPTPSATTTPVLGTDYAFSLFQWPSHHLTYSFVPDGTITANGGPPSNLQATFNAEMGNGVWQAQFARVFASWGAAANLTFTQVPDNGSPIGSPGSIQGNSNFGDIRISGYNFNSPTLLAQTYYPDPTSTVGGDSSYDTAQPFSVGGANGSYDLFSVAEHEIGLALGLAEVPNPTEVMYGIYTGVRSGLAPGDLYGIQQLYGPPLPPAAMAAEPTMLTPKQERAVIVQQAHDEAIAKAAKRQVKLELAALARMERQRERRAAQRLRAMDRMRELA